MGDNGGLICQPMRAAAERFCAMVDQIDELKRKYTDKYVVVDHQRPELARFRDTYGQVKTVNMSGRALVEFADYHLNIGWYDIDPSFLKLIDQPLPPKPKEAPAKATEAKKPPGEVASATGKPAAVPKPAAKPAAGKQSTADILAALRGGGAAKTQATGEVASAAGGATAKPAAPKPAAAPAAKVERSKMSVADMLAAARGAGAVGPIAAPTPAKPQAAPAPVEEVPAGEVASATGESVKKSAGEQIDKKTMTIEQMIAWCRQHDN
jgi:hypothetical protein